MNSNVLDNFEKHTFFHGTSLGDAEAIAQHGFRVWFEDDEIGRYASGGNLGIGIYISCNWRIALWFGPVLLRVTIRPGTRLLNSALPPDGKIVDYLQKEFGREILRRPPRQVLPKNKRLKLRELISLFRYHYWHTWEREYSKDRDGVSKWPTRRDSHSRLLDDFKSLLIRYGFDGYGNPDDDNGIVVFAEDRVVFEEIVAEIPSADYSTLHGADFQQFPNVAELKEFFRCYGSSRAKELAERIAPADTDKRRR
jgi:hypothetical protein